MRSHEESVAGYEYAVQVRRSKMTTQPDRRQLEQMAAQVRREARRDRAKKTRQARNMTTNKLRLWTCMSFESDSDSIYYPGTAAIIWAYNKRQAVNLLRALLLRNGFSGKFHKRYVCPVNPDKPEARLYAGRSYLS
jgi:hypothetical protein